MRRTCGPSAGISEHVLNKEVYILFTALISAWIVIRANQLCEIENTRVGFKETRFAGGQRSALRAAWLCG